MDTLLVISLILFIESSDAFSIVRDTDVSDCQVKLTNEIEQCLQKYEAKYLVYSDQDSSLQLKEAMQTMLCREYESSLQCLHIALKECPATDFHLQMIGSRLGHVRSFMATLCEHSNHKSTTILPNTTTTTSIPVQDVMDSSGEGEENFKDIAQQHKKPDTNNIVSQRKHDKSSILKQSKQDFVPQIFKKSMLKKMNKEFHNEVVYKQLRHTKPEVSKFQSFQQNFNDCLHKKDSKCTATNEATAVHIIDWMLFLSVLCLYTWF